ELLLRAVAGAEREVMGQQRRRVLSGAPAVGGADRVMPGHRVDVPGPADPHQRMLPVAAPAEVGGKPPGEGEERDRRVAGDVLHGSGHVVEDPAADDVDPAGGSVDELADGRSVGTDGKLV